MPKHFNKTMPLIISPLRWQIGTLYLVYTGLWPDITLSLRTGISTKSTTDPLTTIMNTVTSKSDHTVQTTPCIMSLGKNMAIRSNEDIEETIRRCICDEMCNFQYGQSRVQSLLNRTRSLIRTATYSTAREMEGNSTLQFENLASRRPSKRQALSSSVPGHPYHPRRKRTANEGTVILKHVHLID